MDKQTLPANLRRASQDDIGFIFNSWLKSYRNSLFAKSVSNAVYFSEHHKIIEKLAKTSEIIIACNPDDPDQIYGYVCAEKVDGIFVLHYIYVKQPFRKLGLATFMLNAFDRDPSQPSIHTHQTKIAELLAAKYNTVYHPYLLINVEQEQDVNS